MGFNIQIEWLASTFGSQVADVVVMKSIGDAAIHSPYLKPLYTLAHSCNIANVSFDPEPHDLNARSGPQNLGSRLSEILARGQATKLSAA